MPAPPPTRAECAAADEAHAQREAAHRAAQCYQLADRLAMALDKRPSEWTANDKQDLHDLHDLLTAAMDRAEWLS